MALHYMERALRDAEREYLNESYRLSEATRGRPAQATPPASAPNSVSVFHRFVSPLSRCDHGGARAPRLARKGDFDGPDAALFRCPRCGMILDGPR